jgi:hypothetical protein
MLVMNAGIQVPDSETIFKSEMFFDRRQKNPLSSQLKAMVSSFTVFQTKNMSISYTNELIQ